MHKKFGFKPTVEYRKLTTRFDGIEFVDGIAVTDEDSLCIACTHWFDRVVGRPFDLIHIPNEGVRTKANGAKLKSMGMRAGAPDYIVSKNGTPIGYMEFKFGKNGLQNSQKEFRDYVQGKTNWALIRTFEEFKDKLIEWGVYQPQTGKGKEIFK